MFLLYFRLIKNDFSALFAEKSRMTKREAVDERKPQALSHEGKGKRVADGATLGNDKNWLITFLNK